MAYTNDSRPTSSYSNDIKPSSTTNYLLKEDSFFLLLETGAKIVITRSNDYNYDAKPV